MQYPFVILVVSLLIFFNGNAMEQTQKIVKVNELSLWTESFGDAKDTACLLICGAGAPAKFWTDRFCQSIADKGFFVIRYDHRDQGMSSSVDFDKNPYTVLDLANDAAFILDAYEISKAHIVGHSMGGMIAQALAIHHPNRLFTMTSMCVSTVGEGKAPPKEVMDVLLQNKPTQDFDADLPNFMQSWRVLNGDIEIDEEIAIAYTKDFYERSRLPVGVAWNHIRCQERLGDISEELSKISIPTLFIAGEKDVMMPKARVFLENAKLVPKSKCVIIPKMGHMFFNRCLEDMISGTLLQFFPSRLYKTLFNS